MVDYDAARAAFSWDAAASPLDGLPGGAGLNIAHEAVDRHAAGPNRDRVAMRWIARDGSITEATYADLARADEPVRRASRVTSVSARVTGCSACSAVSPSCTSPCWGP